MNLTLKTKGVMGPVKWVKSSSVDLPPVRELEGGNTCRGVYITGTIWLGLNSLVKTQCGVIYFNYSCGVVFGLYPLNTNIVCSDELTESTQL